MTAIDGSSILDASGTLLCRGMRDLLPDEMARFRRVERAFLDTCRAWGYEEVRTPTLEHLYLFTSSGTLAPQVLGNVYSFLDWDGWTGERVVLRPECTIPVARLYREELRRPSAKLAYVENTFQFHAGDEPREVWQCGAELIGESWPAGDLEALALALVVLRELGLRGLRIELAHAGAARALLASAGFSDEELEELYDRLLSGDAAVLERVGARRPELTAALRLLDAAPGGEGYIANLRAAFGAVPELARPLDELAFVARAAAAAGILPEISVAAQRDFEYYTGPVYRISSGSTVLASGGRYDRLVVDADGVHVPACGFALFIDRIAPLLPAAAAPVADFVRVRPVHDTPEGYAAAAATAGALQRLGVPAGLLGSNGQARWTLSVAVTSYGRAYTLAGRSGGDGIDAASLDAVAATVKGLRQ